MVTDELTRVGTLLELQTEHGVLRYHQAGDPDAPPLVLLHGSGPGVTGWRNYRGNLAKFAEHFNTYILEFPGFGVSDDTRLTPMPARFRWSRTFSTAPGPDRPGPSPHPRSAGAPP